MTTTYQNEYQSSIRRAKAEKANLSLTDHFIKASSSGYELYRKDMRGGLLGEFVAVSDAVKAANAEDKGPREGATPVPAKKRMAELRHRRREAGMTPMEVWAHPDDHQAIRELAVRLANARDEAANYHDDVPA